MTKIEKITIWLFKIRQYEKEDVMNAKGKTTEYGQKCVIISKFYQHVSTFEIDEKLVHEKWFLYIYINGEVVIQTW